MGKGKEPTSQPAPIRPTLKTIATMTGLGVTTVSRALKNAPDISQATKSRVSQVAQQIGYRPNRAGVRLRTGKTNVISLVLNLDEEIMGLTSQLVLGITDALTSTSYHLIITPYSTEPMDAVRYITETGSADGIILSRTEPQDARVQYLHDNQVPFATHGRTMMDIEHPYHDFDNESFTSDAVGLLAKKNRTRVALLGPPAELTYHHHAMKGYCDAAQRYGVTPFPLPGITIDDSLDDIEARIKAVMSRSTRPDGFISMSGGSTIALCAGIEAAALILGTDVDIVSKQSVNILPRFRKSIIVVNEDIRLAGREVATAVIKSINNAAVSELQSIVYRNA